MIPMNRTTEPEFLASEKEKWTDDYIKTGNFNWHSRELLLKDLKAMTKDHCAFCDDVLSPIGSADPEIEHFKPKSRYKDLAFEWENLYPICRHCNGTKNDIFDDLLLKPDEIGYQYNDWFRLDPNSFELKPIKAGNIHWNRAETTIRIYGFNKPDKVGRRTFVSAEIADNKYSSKDFQPFRFL